MQRVHLDHNATTPMRPEARHALLAALDAGLGNASSIHDAGRRARAFVDEARERVAAALNVPEDAVVFTGGGTESNNLAVLGAADSFGPKLRMVTSTIEHAAVLEPFARAASRGHSVHQVGVDVQGRLDLEALGQATQAGGSGGRRAAEPASPVLVSLQAANNEIGSTVDLGAVRAAIGAGAMLHTDAVQACGKLPLHLLESGVDLASLSAHKVGGPLGVGVLVRRAGMALSPRTFGGAQEAELRPGTENVPAIAAAAVAIELAVEETRDFAGRTAELTRTLWDGLVRALPGLQLNGPPIDDPSRLPNTLNVSFRSGDARTLVTRLDLAGIEVSSGSACASGSIEPSHVLIALGHDPERARAGVRMSLGRTTSLADIHIAVDRLRTTLGSLS